MSIPDEDVAAVRAATDLVALIGEYAALLESDKDRREMERAMRDDLLEISRYPEIVFMSTSVSSNRTGEGEYLARIVGQLSLHGVTREHSIDVRLAVSEESLRAQGEFPLRQTDHNIKPVSVAGGTLKMRDELKFSFDIVARQT